MEKEYKCRCGVIIDSNIFDNEIEYLLSFGITVREAARRAMQKCASTVLYSNILDQVIEDYEERQKEEQV